MNMGCQCGDTVRKANRTLSCIHKCITSRSKEVILPLYITGRSWGVLRPVLGAALQEGCGQHGEGPEEATHIIRGQQGRPYEERLWDLHLFSLHKRRVRGDLVAVYKLASRQWDSPGSPEHYWE